MQNRVLDRLWTRSYILLCIATFLMSFSFFLLVPTLPFYLVQKMGVAQELVGPVLSCYVVAVLCVRPFAGFVADMFKRKQVYIISYMLFAVAFLGYLIVRSNLLLFVLLRIFHGFAFGALNTTGNTLVIDIMPSSRRGEGLGYFGVMNNLAMAFGPMVGLFIISGGDYMMLFAVSLLFACVGLCLGTLVKAPNRTPAKKVNAVISIDRFFMIEGLPACFSLFLLAIPYGMTTSYMAMYAAESGITSHSGLFFTVMAFGLIVSRLISGKKVDRGMVTQTIRNGMFIALLGVAGEALLSLVAAHNLLMGYSLYFASAMLVGYGFGTMFPAFNTLFVSMAPNSRRATANATYLTGWDVGIGCGMLLGGNVAGVGYAICFMLGAVLVIVSLLFFVAYVTRHYNSHKVH
ncbi:MAG: MFS transporter [Bacteroidaceae bacterium]|nr:MFS transporter [Bacteroidaceae bacterium]